MAIIYIDKQPFEVKAGKNLLEACLSLGLDLPYFCWHPALGSVGACRQCAIKVYKDESDEKGRLSMACMEPVKEGQYLSVADPAAKNFRAGIIELLMTNHPHDCPVCDEGGSCHLQDMTVMTGHSHRRYYYKKRTYKNQYLGPFLNHEMNRCIQCYRCVRFYKDYAGGKDLDVFAAHNHVYFGREKDGVLESEFSGNLAEVCPTGVFTDKTLKEHYTRKWDLTMAPSICQHCSLGCNTIAGERYGELRSITNRYNSEVNGYFLCDRGRFGYEFVNSISRITQPLVRNNHPDAVDKTQLFSKLKEVFGRGGLIGVGSPRASLESNFALRQLVGEENFFRGLSEKEAAVTDLILQIISSGEFQVPSLKDAEQADCILILGEDVTNTAPRLALSLRQAVLNKPLEKTKELNIPVWQDAARRELIQQDKEACYIAFPVKTKLDEIASSTWHAAPDDIARFGFAIAMLLEDNALDAEALNDSLLGMVRQIASSLLAAERPLIVSGASLFNEAIIEASAAVASALGKKGKKAGLCFVVQDCNTLGLALMGGKPITAMENKPKLALSSTLIVLENDLFRIAPEEDINSLLDGFEILVALDHLHNKTTNRANILIPSATFAEADGTLVNNEGRAQRFFQVFMPANPNITESWRWLNEMAALKNANNVSGLSSHQDIIDALVKEMPQFGGVEKVAPPADLRIVEQKVPRETQRYSGRTAILAKLNVSEPAPAEDYDSPLSFSMEGYKGIAQAPLTPFFWAPGWNSNQAVNKYQVEIAGPLRGGDPGKRVYMRNGALRLRSMIPPAFSYQPNEWQLIPLPHIFGSEELSIYTSGIEELTPDPYIAINHQDATRFGVDSGDSLELTIGARRYRLGVVVKEELPAGCAGIPYNVDPFVGINWPAKGIIRKEGT